MSLKFGAWLAAAGLFCLAVPLVAHHSFSVEYDVNKPLKLKGVVTKLEWTNPHAHVYEDVVDEKGVKTSGNFEMASPTYVGRVPRSGPGGTCGRQRESTTGL